MKNIYPNPFNPVTKLSYDIEKAGNLKISVYNILGQEVAELYNDYQYFSLPVLKISIIQVNLFRKLNKY